MRGIIQFKKAVPGSVIGGLSPRFAWALKDSERYSRKSTSTGPASASPIAAPPASRNAAFHQSPERSPTKIRTSAKMPTATNVMKVGSGMPVTMRPATESPRRATGSRRDERTAPLDQAHQERQVHVQAEPLVVGVLKNQPESPYTLPASTAAATPRRSMRAAK